MQITNVYAVVASTVATAGKSTLPKALFPIIAHAKIYAKQKGLNVRITKKSVIFIR